MIEDDVMREVRAVREAYARLHNFDVRAMVEDLRVRDLAGDYLVVRHPSRRPRPVTVPVGQAPLLGVSALNAMPSSIHGAVLRTSAQSAAFAE